MTKNVVQHDDTLLFLKRHATVEFAQAQPDATLQPS
jgi:hypothetical protein